MTEEKEKHPTAARLCRDSKEEIAQKPIFSRRDKLAFFSALVFSSGSLLIHGESVAVSLLTENEYLIASVRSVVESLTGKECRITRKGRRNEILVENALSLLCACKVLDTSDGSVTVCNRIAPEFAEEQSAAAYIRGAYLGSGSLSAGKYHLEFSFGRKTLAEDFASLLQRYGIGTGLAVRKSRAVVYAKDSEKISDCLALMGAGKAVLAFNSLLAERQMSEHLNRQQNCDMHNIDKQIDTGLRQCEFLRALEPDDLSPVLRETAAARLAHPDFSYEQLAQATGVSKSGLKNRLRRLREIYEKANKGG